MTNRFLVEKILMPDSRETELSGDLAVISKVGKTCMSKHLCRRHDLIFYYYLCGWVKQQFNPLTCFWWVVTYFTTLAVEQANYVTD